MWEFGGNGQSRKSVGGGGGGGGVKPFPERQIVGKWSQFRNLM